MNKVQKGLGYIILFAPLIFVCHFSEEVPGFVAWFNQHVSRGINSGLFWNVNIFALVITTLVVVMEWLSPNSLSISIITLWFSFLMFANAVFHITGALMDQHYMPGLFTAIILYLPYFFWIVIKILKSRRLKTSMIISLAILGSLPMFIHGYRILFLGSRLF